LAEVIPMDGSQPNVDCTQEEPPSQNDIHVDKYIDVYTHTDGLLEASGGQPGVRMSSRLSAQEAHAERVPERASMQATSRDMAGRNITSHNSFSLLDDDIIRARALEMGVNLETLPMERINYLKDMEHARHAIADVQEKQLQNEDTENPRVLGYGEEHEDEEGFTLVISRRNEKKRKSVCKKAMRRESPAKSGGSRGGAQAKSGAALGKVFNDHPLCDIVTRPRYRKKILNIYDMCLFKLQRCGQQGYEHFFGRFHQGTRC
jgi:hypothetical protein